jgi:alkylated DNA nucleotide flippase Atl1
MEAYQRTHELLTEHREDVIKLAEQLMEFEVMTYRDVERLIGPRKYPTKVIVGKILLISRELICPRFLERNLASGD